MADSPVLTDDFTRGADESLATSADWDQVNFYFGAASITAATGRVDVGAATASCQNRAAGAHDADQYVEVDVNVPVGYQPNSSTVWVRCTGTTTVGNDATSLNGYAISLVGNGVLNLYKYTAGVEGAALWTNTDGWTEGDRLRIEITGTTTTTIKVYRNGTLYDSGSGYTYQDTASPHTTGAPGLALWYQGGSWFDNWESGDISAGGTLTIDDLDTDNEVYPGQTANANGSNMDNVASGTAEDNNALTLSEAVTIGTVTSTTVQVTLGARGGSNNLPYTRVNQKSDLAEVAGAQPQHTLTLSE